MTSSSLEGIQAVLGTAKSLEISAKQHNLGQAFSTCFLRHLAHCFTHSDRLLGTCYLPLDLDHVDGFSVCHFQFLVHSIPSLVSCESMMKDL